MEIVLPLLAYVGILAGVLWVAARGSVNAPIEPNPPRERVKRELTRGDKVLAETAQQHGLRHDVDVASGRVGELRVEVAAFPNGTDPMEFRGTARFPRSLGLELSVKQRGVFGGRSGEAVVSTDFDHDFDVDALHADQARALLGGDVEKALRRGVSRGFRLGLDDEALSLAVGAELGPERAVEAMSWLVRTAELIVAARARLKRPELEERLLDSFGALAQSLGGVVEADVLCLDLEEGKLRAHVDHLSGKRFRTQISLTFAKPLALELRLGLESERSRFARFRQRDITLGDDAFDDAFVVVGEPEDEVKATLDAPLRKKLMALLESVDSLAVTPTEIDVAVDEALADREQLGDLVEAVRDVARTLAPRRVKGAYR